MNNLMFLPDPYNSPDGDAKDSPFSDAISKTSSAMDKDQTLQLTVKDDDSKDLLEHIPYLNKLEHIENEAAELLEKKHADGTYLLELLDTANFDKGLVKEFKTMINMIKHMNSMLFKGNMASGFKVRPRTLDLVEEIAVQVIHYFDKLGDKFDAGIDKIVEVKQHLPSLGLEVKPEHLRTALKIWHTKITGELAKPLHSEKKLFDGFAIFYDAQIYHAFLQVRKEHPRHEMCLALAEHFDAIDHYVEHVRATYAVLIRESEKFKTAIGGAMQRLLGDHATLLKQYRTQRTLKHFKAKVERADAALASSSAAMPHPTQPGPSQEAAAKNPASANVNADVAAMDQYFKQLDVGEGASEQKATGSKGKRNSKGKSGKGKRRSK